MRKNRRNRNNKNEGIEEPKHNRYEVTQTRKVISSYGGVGSIVETPNGSILIEPFNKWRFFNSEELYKDERIHIKDKRFLSRLKFSFEKLEALVQVPENTLNGYYPEDFKKTIAASYFPKWMFCPKCRTFDHIDNWLKNWKNEVKNKDFQPPKCFKCYHKAVKNKKRKKYSELEQIRFIMTSPSGSIADICWDRWVFSQKKKSKEEKENDTNSIKRLDFDNDIRKDIYFEYKVSDKFNNMTGISIIAKDFSGKKIDSKTLSGLFSLRVEESNILGFGNADMKVTIRSSNSVYYPNILNSLQLPNEEAKDDTEEAYRLAEFEFITNQTEYKSEDGYLTIEKVSEDFYNVSGLKNIYRLDNLKMTSVQVSYTRQEPIDKDYYLKDILQINNQGQILRKRYTSEKGINTEYLPAIENLGEGIFFEFDIETINEWIDEHDDKLNKRAKAIQDNYEKTKLSEHEQRTITPKYLLIHTFSHIIIKELEFLSGYPATSLQERLYISDDMQGVLIYTIAGAEGSYGGLVSLCDDTKIGGIIHSALERAKDCASDPICEDTDLSGQGVGGTNLAACYSCALLPETSCEEFNRFLDRQALNSFFKD